MVFGFFLSPGVVSGQLGIVLGCGDRFSLSVHSILTMWGVDGNPLLNPRRCVGKTGLVLVAIQGAQED
jgi:hypothetical protein